MDTHTPSAVANVTCGSFGKPLVCPQCGKESFQQYGLMGSDKPMVCGRCYDDNVFEGKPELRAEMDRSKAQVLGWMLGNADLLGEIAAEATLVEADD